MVNHLNLMASFFAGFLQPTGRIEVGIPGKYSDFHLFSCIKEWKAPKGKLSYQKFISKSAASIA